MMLKKVKSYAFASVLLTATPFAFAESPVAGLSSSAAAELLFQLETLQQEVQSLRGQLEEQGHELKLMKQSQRDRYIDLDKRISLMMSSASKATVVASPTVPLAEQPASVNRAVPSSSPSVLRSSPLAPVSLEAPSVESKKAYDDAYDLIRQRNFEQAEKALSLFVENFPKDTLTGNGYYWLGEVKLVQNKREEAIVAFTTVIERFPGHNKESDSLYKLGTVSDQLADTAKAKSYLQDVIRRFPDSKAAQLAAGYLSNIK